MQEMRIFENAEFGKVRTAEINGEPYFVGKDVAEILGYKNTKDAIIKHVDEQDRRVIQRSEITTLENYLPKEALPVNFVDANIPNRGLTIINESGLYALIFGSKLESAKRFKNWVTSEVLPSIRKTGGYMSKQMEINKMTLEMIQELTNTVKQLISATAAEKAAKENETVYGTPLKIETFPDELLEQVDSMLYDMQKYQRMNYSLIARFCTMNGYPISSPAIKRYFNRKINNHF